MLRNNRGQVFMIIEILVVVAIIVVAGLTIGRSYLGGGKSDTPGAPPTPKERAHAVACTNNLQQIRTAINMLQTESDKFPASLAEIADKGGLSNSMLNCDVSGKPYNYDPTEGKVSCTTPGHEGY